MDNVGELPAILPMHGTTDTVGSLLHDRRIHDTLLARGAQDVTLVSVEGAGHGGDLFDARVDEIIDFLRTHPSN